MNCYYQLEILFGSLLRHQCYSPQEIDRYLHGYAVKDIVNCCLADAVSSIPAAVAIVLTHQDVLHGQVLHLSFQVIDFNKG